MTRLSGPALFTRMCFNVAGWELSIALGNGDDPDAAERFTAAVDR